MSPHSLHTPEFGSIEISSHAAQATFPTSLRITPTTRVPTDIWRKPGPPLINTFNAPILYREIELERFVSVGVKVSAKWTNLYDQGGLVFIIPPPSTSTSPDLERKWVKTGIEFYEGREYVSTVSCDNWADWSLAEVYPPPSTSSTSTQQSKESGKVEDGGRKGVQLLIERLPKDDTFWVYVVDEGGKKRPVREVTWVLSEGRGEVEEEEVKKVWVGVYAATPTGMEGRMGREELEVWFEDLVFVERD